MLLALMFALGCGSKRRAPLPLVSAYAASPSAVVASVATVQRASPPEQDPPEMALERGLPPLPAESAIRVFDAVRFGEQVIALEEGGTALVAIDLATRARPWRRALPAATRYAALSRLTPTRAMLLRNDELLVADVRDGSIITRAPGMWSCAESRAQLWVRGGACAIRCGCDEQPIDCETGEVLGQRLRAPEIRRYPVGQGHFHTTDCIGHAPFVLGRAGDIAVYGDGRGLIGIDVHSGERRYTSTLAAPHPAPEDGERSADALSCWATNHSASVAVVDCATGKERWSATPPALAEPHRDYDSLSDAIWIDDEPQALFTLTWSGKVTVFDGKTGAVRFSRALPKATYALPSGFRSERSLMIPDGTRETWFISPDDGRVLVKLPMGGEGTLVTQPGGERVLKSSRGVFDMRGAKLAPLPSPRFAVDTDAQHLTVRERGRVVLSIEQADAWHEEVTHGTETLLVLLSVVENSHAELRVLHAGP